MILIGNKSHEFSTRNIFMRIGHMGINHHLHAKRQGHDAGFPIRLQHVARVSHNDRVGPFQIAVAFNVIHKPTDEALQPIFGQGLRRRCFVGIAFPVTSSDLLPFGWEQKASWRARSVKLIFGHRLKRS